MEWKVVGARPLTDREAAVHKARQAREQRPAKARAGLFEIFEPHMSDEVLGRTTTDGSASLDLLHDRLDEWFSEHFPQGRNDRPQVVTLLGSTRFYETFQQAYYRLTMAGLIVLSVGFVPDAEARGVHGEGVGHDSAEKVALDELHKRKIDISDVVYVLDVDGYIGDSTRGEIEYAEEIGVPVVYSTDTAIETGEEYSHVY